MALIILGKKDSYSDLAATHFINHLNISIERSYFDHITHCFIHFSDYDYLVLPVENSTDGYLQQHLDLLFASGAVILAEYYQKVSFDFISFGLKDDIKQIMGHEAALNQCMNFLAPFKTEIVKAPNNIYAYEYLNTKKEKTLGAVVPSHLVVDCSYPTHKRNIEDQLTNQTRFFLLSKKEKFVNRSHALKASIVITPIHDSPGLLYSILKIFADKHINLTSIISRPIKEKPNHYHFFIELTLSNIDELSNIKQSKDYTLTVLGIYDKTA